MREAAGKLRHPGRRQAPGLVREVIEDALSVGGVGQHQGAAPLGGVVAAAAMQSQGFQSGTTDIIFAEPKHPYTIGLMASVPRLDSPCKVASRAIEGLPPNLAHVPHGCPFSPRCSFAMDQCHQEEPQLEPVSEGH